MAYTLRQNPAHSNNYSVGRTQKIRRIVDHHAATTDFDGIGRTFQNPNRIASAHYGVGRNGNVDQYVQEKDTAYHAGTPDPATNPNPNSIGIEHVNMTGAPDWAIDEATMNTTVELHYDIAKRHGLLPLKVGKNLFAGDDIAGHRDFSPTFCPGQIYDRLQEIANRVNAMAGGAPDPAPQPPQGPDQILHVGEKFKFADSYRVDNLALVGGIWQIQTVALCPKGFTWADNGIPTTPVNEVGGGAGNPHDQRLEVGARYNIPGVHTVLDIGQYQDRWLAKVNIGGWTFWVDVETLTEV